MTGTGRAAWLSALPIAHRGFHTADGPGENTIGAFERAAAHGMPIELDVQLTADGELAVVHDVAVVTPHGELRPVASLFTTDRRGLRLGPAGEPVPVLAEALEMIAGRVPVMVDVRRWKPQFDGRLERAVADCLRTYRGEAAVQSFDPVAIARLGRLLPDVPVGQASGVLHQAGRLTRLVGRLMPTNAFLRPDFIAYELSELPSKVVSFWTDPVRRPLLAFPVTSAETETTARSVADNFYFSGYLPDQYARPAH